MKKTMIVMCKALVLLTGILLAGHLHAEPAGADSLKNASSPLLQVELEHSLEKLGLNQAVKEKRLAVALVDITDRDEPKLAAINGDHMMYSASLPKIAILFGAFQRIEEGSLKLNDSVLKQMTDMIRFSSNVAASSMLELVGPQYLLGLLQSDRYRFYDVNNHGGLWVGKTYGKGQAFKRDPLNSLSHGATALQVARYYYLLETGRLVSSSASKAMKEILGNPGVHHKFVAGLEQVHPDSAIYRKSGTWQNYHCDSALIERDGRTYIAVALAHDPQGGEWMSRLIVEMDKIVFSHGKTVQVAG